MNDIIEFKPRGRLDALGARALWSELEPLTRVPQTRVLVDLSETRYSSSEGLRVLIRASRSMQQRGGKLVLCCAGARLLEIISMAGLDRILEIHPTAADARAALETFSA